jgi:hypothetical protein
LPGATLAWSRNAASQLEKRESTVAALEDQIVYEERNDLVPEVYRDLFNNADWIVHRFTVYGVWVYVLTFLACHTSLWVGRPW